MIAGAEHDVELLSPAKDGRLVVSFDGITFEVFLGEPDSKGRTVVLDGRPLRVGLASSRRGSHVLEVDGERILVSLGASKFGPAAIDSSSIRAERVRVLGEERNIVAAHMPGKITSVKIRPRDRVSVGTPMFVLVAMKMENTITASISGIVREVRVVRGTSVNKGDVLAIIQ